MRSLRQDALKIVHEAIRRVLPESAVKEALAGEAFTAAGKSINIYRSPARRRAEAFSQGLTDAPGTYASVLQWTGKETDAARIRQERGEVFRQIEEMEAGDN